MAKTVGDVLIERLRDWGVEFLFGYPGDGINGIMGALGRAGNRPRFVQARHEETAAFMACGHAKFSGRVGVCLATSGPGAIHLLNGLYDAKLDHQPVVAIVGQQAQTALGGDYQQEVDLAALFKDVAHEYVHRVAVPQQLPALIDRALRIAIVERTVTCVIVPADVQEMKHAPPEHAFKMVPSSLGVVRPRIVPPQAEILRAAEVLNAGKRVAILVGQGARHAHDELLEVADRLGAGIAKALLGKDVVADDLPHVTGSIGLLGTRPSYQLMMGCDTLLMVGSSFPYAQFLPEPGRARGVQIDVDGRMIGIRYPMEVNLVGDAGETLRALLPLLRHQEDRSWRERIEEEVAAWWRVVDARADVDADPINPQHLFRALSGRLPHDAILTCDSGSATHWYARDLKLRPPMRASLSGTLATMGCAVPYAIAAKFVAPSRPVIACVGDGAMQMNGMNELLTIAKYWREWEDPRLVIVVLHNDDLNLVTWEMRALAGDPKFEESQSLPDFHYARHAELCGLAGVRIETKDEVAPGLDTAFRADRPVVVDVLTDPDVPPLPPHVTFDQAKGMLASLLKGDPDAGAIVRKAFKGKIKEFLQ